MPHAVNFIDLTGQKLGRWTVLTRDRNTATNRATWLCKCDCGTVRPVYAATLTRLKQPSRSCGCANRGYSAARCKVYFAGKTMTIAQWAKELGIDTDILVMGISDGLSVGKTLSRFTEKLNRIVASAEETKKLKVRSLAEFMAEPDE